MTHRPLSTPSGLRVFSASLLSALLIMMPFVQLAAAEQRSVARSQRTEPQGAEVKDQASNASAENLFVNPPVLPLVGITATKTDTYTAQPGPAAPGDEITYTVDINNPSGTEATGVTLTDIIDANTTRFGADFNLKVSPLAINDTYAAEQGVPLSVSAPGVLTNDTGVPTPTATAIVAGPTTAGGTVTLNTDGSFTYTAINAGFTGADTFTYTITNGNAPPNPGVDNVATVTINVDAAPTVTSTTPTNGAINQATTANIDITFSEAVDVTGSWFTISCTSSGAHTATVTGGPTTYTLNPDTDFTQGETCTVTVVAAQVTDQDTNDPPNNMAANYVFSFTMDAAPSVTATTPIDTATGVGTQSDITLTFSESVNLTAAPVTISCATSGAHNVYSVSASPNTAFTINPSADFVPNELCTVTVLANQVSDADSNDPPNNMVGNYVFSFTTDAAPTVTGTTPTAGATNVASDISIVVNFSETVNVTGSAFTLTCNSIAQPFTLTPAAPGGVNSFTLDPTSNFPAGSSCTMTVVALQVSDTDGGDPPDNMVANHVLNFTVDAAPTVTITVPTNGATQVANNASISITFSESVNLGATPVTISCATSGAHTSVVSASPNTVFTVNPDTDFANGELCTVTVLAAQVTDNDANDPPDNMAGDHVFNFTVDSPPTVTSTTPANTILSNLKTTNITINFSENVGVTAGGVTINCGAGNLGFSGLPQTNVNQVVLDPTLDLPAGSTCTVTVLSANTTDTDTGDPPNNLDGDNNGTEGGDYVFTFGVAPDAVNDIDNATGNIGLAIPANGVLANDVGPGAVVDRVGTASANTVVPATVATSNGGSVTMNADGSFTYVPLAGQASGTDTFKYRISNAGGVSADATVTITMTGIVWFICDGCGGSNAGTLQNPYTSINSFSTNNTGAANKPSDNQRIYIRSGTYDASNDNLTLRAGQIVSGQGQAATSFFTPESPAPAAYAALTASTRPIIAPTSGNAVTVNNGNTISHFDIGNGSSSTSAALLTGPTTGNWSLTASSMILNGRGRALDLSTAAGSAVTLTATFDTVSTSNSTLTGITLTRVNGTLTMNGGAISGVTGDDVFIDAGTVTVIYSGTINNTAARSVNIANKTSSGNVTFNGKITDSGTGILSDNNDGATLTFKSLSLSTGANTAFSAINGGTVVVTNGLTDGINNDGDGSTDEADEANTITTTSGIALNVVNTNIGASDMTFQSISAGTGAGSAGVGINLNATGASGGLHVTGTGTADSGGTIQHKTGADGSTTSGIGIYLNDTDDVQLNNMQLNDFDNNAIRGSSIIGFVLNNLDITGNNGTIAGANQEYAVYLVNVTGTVNMVGNEISGGFNGNIGMDNSSGTTNLNFLSNNVHNTQDDPLTSGDGFNLEADTTAVLLANVSNNTFNNNEGDDFNLSLINSAVVDLTFNNNDIDGDPEKLSAGVFILGASFNGSLEYDISNNNVQGANQGGAIFVNKGSGTATYSGQIVDNVIGNPAVNHSGALQSVGIHASARGAGGSHTTLIHSNEVYQYHDRGIVLEAGEGSPTFVATVTSNTVSNFADAINSLHGIHFDFGILAADNAQITVDVRNNLIATSGNEAQAGVDFRMRTAGSNDTFVAGCGSCGAAAGTQTFIDGQNPDGTTFSVTSSASGTYNNGPASPLPAPNLPELPPAPLMMVTGGVEAALLGSFDTLVNNAAHSSLTQAELDTLVNAAFDRWSASGLTGKQVTAMRELRFELGDLTGSYLGEASGNRIVVDRNAQGKGWFVDSTPADDIEFGERTSATRSYTNPLTLAAGRIDLLTAIEHEIGHRLGLSDSYSENDRDSIMYGYLTVGERRMPARGEAANAQASSLTGTHFLKLKKAEGSKQKAVSRKNHAATTRALAPVSGETLTHVVGTLPAGKKVRITFKVTVNAGFSGPTVSNQGTVTGTIGGAFSILTDDPDVPPNAGETDPTVTQIVGPTTANDDAYNAFKNTPLNIAAPGVLGNDANVTSVTGVGGCVDVTDPFTGCATTGGGTLTMNGNGSFSYVPLTGFTGPDTFTYSVTGGTGTDTATVTITVADTSAIYINEVLFDPPGSDAPNEYIELRGPASTTLPAGTYLVAIEGDAADNPGDVKTVINLSGLSFGSNGYLVLLQQSNTYVPVAGATVVTSTTVGFGGLPGSIWSADSSATDLPDASTTFMLIQTGTAPTLTDDIDSANDGGFDGTVYPGWNVRDSISAMNGSANAQAYGAFSFRNTAGTGTGQGGEVIVPFIPSYVGRVCDSTGSTAADWLASGVLGGSAPNWTLGSSTETEPSSFAGNPLDHIGTTNFVNTAPVNTVPGTQTINEDATLTFNAGNSNLISVADSDAGGGTLSVTISVVAGQLTLSQTIGLSFSNGDGTDDTTMTFTGNLTDINAALNGLLFEPTINDDTDDTLTITVNDQGNTGGAACSTAQSDTDTVNITVNAVNDAPVLDNTGNMALNSIPQDISAASNTGTLVSDIIASAGGDRITDADAGAVEGLAVNTVDNSNGAWEYSTNGGGIWTAFGSPTDTTARLLAADANTRIRFQPNAGFNGTRSITFRAWDQTSGTNGGTGDASVNGGATAFSTATETATITVSSTVSVQDATVAEPASGTTNMVFTVTLNAPAAPGGAAVNFTTADEPAGPGKAVAGVCGSGGDYVLTSGTVNFTVGQQVKTISVPICSDNASEPDETFLVVLSSPSGASIADGTATGTIKSTNPAGAVLISELRTSGPGGAGDDFVEIYNNSNSPLTVAASDASAGYGLYKMGADCNATPILIGVIPNGTVIPARGHYLFVGSAYSLANYGGTGAAAGNLILSADIETDRNVGLFSTSNIAGISSVNRLDAVGFGANTGGACDLLREGSTLPPIAGNATIEHSYFRKMCDWIQGSGCTVPGVPKDTNNNSVDFWLADTTGAAITGRLGAPGPENLASPIRRDSANNPGSGGIDVFLLDSTVGSAAQPNRQRLGVDPPSTFGSMTLRYRVTNNTGAPVTRLRYRIVDISTANQPPGPTADLRALTSSNQTVGPVNDTVTCTAGGAGAPPCTVTVQATTLETPPNQVIGGGYNSTLSSGTITTGTPLPNGQSILINFKLGVEKTGTFRFYVVVEALP